MPRAVMEHPNVLLILTDQQRFDTISGMLNNFGCNTGAMNTMLRNGVGFSNHYCTAPICCPSRSAIMTGMFPSATGMEGNIGNPSNPLRVDLGTIGDRMQKAGYETVYHGKSHLGGDLRHYGFEIAYENSHDESTRIEACRYWRNKDWIVSKRPFFHVVSFLDPHDIYYLEPGAERPVELQPWGNQDDDLSKKPWPQKNFNRGNDWSPQRWQYYREFYGSRCERVDREIAIVLEELICGGFGNDTWVIFTSDHGDMCGEHGLAFKGPWMYDGQVRVPLIIVPPRTGFTGKDDTVDNRRTFKPFISDALTSNIDLVPTILDIAGQKPDVSLPGRSLLPVVRGEKFEEHEAVFSEWIMAGQMLSPIRMCRTRKWKFNWYQGHQDELYDLENDPGELVNLADDPKHADIVAAMRDRLRRHINDTPGDRFFQLSSTDAQGKPFKTREYDRG